MSSEWTATDIAQVVGICASLLSIVGCLASLRITKKTLAREAMAWSVVSALSHENGELSVRELKLYAIVRRLAETRPFSGQYEGDCAVCDGEPRGLSYVHKDCVWVDARRVMGFLVMGLLPDD